jgi:hypothetical protein
VAFVSALGSSTANSFISVATAVERLGELPLSDGLSDWLSLIAGDQQKTLVASTFSILPLPWKGTICSTDQNLPWPRVICHDGKVTECSFLPYDFEMAVAYTAAYMGQLGGYMQIAPGGGSAPANGTDAIPGLTPEDLKGYEKVSLGKGAIELTLATPNSIQTGVQYLPSFATDLLSKYIKGTGGFSTVKMNVQSVAGVRRPFISGSGLYASTRFVMRNGKLFAESGSLQDLPY